MVYANKLATLGELHTNIKREIAAVSADLCLKIVKNWIQRLDFGKGARGKRNRVSFIMASNVLLQECKGIEKTFVATYLKNPL